MRTSERIIWALAIAAIHTLNVRYAPAAHQAVPVKEIGEACPVPSTGTMQQFPVTDRR
ncbi:hypothetical protein [Glutamicibacter uratoxydans]|uniref:hypothetical protein n=1 Tax=Glutamicibacter uratoxydans TaxID=43667 RepID=UPI003D6E8E9E